MTKILLADDSPVTRAVLKEIFRSFADISVVGEACNGKEAVDMTGRLTPDLVIMDLKMPVMDGLAAIEEIMARFPTPILVLSAALDDREVNRAFTAIKKGALDVMQKPSRENLHKDDGFAVRLVEKARMLARIKVIRHSRRYQASKGTKPTVAVGGGHHTILAIGSSTGGPKAVMSIVKSLPVNFRGTVLIVQHIASGFAAGFAQWLDRESNLRVRVAQDGDSLGPGEAYVAPNDCHMVVEGGKIRLLEEEPVNSCRPSIDVLFNSLADEQGSLVVGILLSGMGKDGALGLRRIKDHGGMTIAQDKESCAVFGMPKAALNLDAVGDVLPLSEIPAAILKVFGTQGGITHDEKKDSAG